jgi:gliding motility-associated-like protein
VYTPSAAEISAGSVTLTLTTNDPDGAGGCDVGQDQVTITINARPSMANAGPDQTNVLCSATLGADLPLVGTGQWSFAPGGNTDGFGVIVNSGIEDSKFNGSPGVSYTLLWTVSNGVCPASQDVVTIGFDPSGATSANAGLDQSNCNSGTFTLAGNEPLSGTGQWSIVGPSNGAVITNPALRNSTVTGLVAASSVTLRWTISNATCSSFAEVELTNLNPPSEAEAFDINFCGATVSLNATPPMVGTGTWSITEGTGGTIATPNDPESEFTGVRGEEYTLRWRVSNGTCPPSDAFVSVSLSEDPSDAAAGSDQLDVCGTVTLAATAPTVGIGAWSFAPSNTGINGTFEGDNFFNGTSGQSYVLRWTVTNGSCTDTDDVLISYSAIGVSSSEPGDDQEPCSTTTGLDAKPPMIGIGVWSFDTGGNPDGAGIINDPNNPKSLFSGTLEQTYTLLWTVTEGACVSRASVSISFKANPSAIAGADISQCPADGIFTIAATPPAIGTGKWTVVSGTAIIAPPDTSPTTQVTGIPINTSAVLRWTVSNGSCPVETDDVQINYCTGGGGTGDCSTVSITPEAESAKCTTPGKIVFKINPPVPIVNPLGVIIEITSSTLEVTNYNDPVFENIPFGIYDYRIVYGSDACIKTGKVTVGQSGTVGTPEVSDIVGPVCAGTASGSLTLDVPGETGNLLEWSLDGLVWESFTAGNQISGIPAGPPPTFSRVISVRRNASDECYAAVEVVIQDQFPPISASITPQQSATCSNSDGSVLVTYGGGDGGPYQFVLDGIPYTMPADNIIRELTGGNHTLRVIDNIAGNECAIELSGNQFFVPSPGLVSFEATQFDPTCEGNGTDARIVVQVDEDFLPGNYEVAISQTQGDYTDFRSIPSNGRFEFTELIKSRYYITVRSVGDDCPNEIFVDITGGPARIDFDVEPISISCFEDAGGLTISNISGVSSLPYTYEVISEGNIVLNGTISTLQALSTVELTGLDKGEYLVVLSQDQSSLISCTLPIRSEFKPFEVVGPTGALDTLYVIRNKSLPDLPTGSVLIGIQESAQEPYEVRLELTEPFFPSQFFLLDWEEATRNSQNLKIEKRVRNLYPGVYSLQLRDNVGCEKIYQITIKSDTNISIPNVFTPNGDGVNDVFYIRNLPQDARLTITNRWGNQVYSSSSYQNDWDGGSAADGVYYYSMRAADQTFTGWVEILRGK